MTIDTARVVVTRPAAQATAFAERVQALGRQPILFPLLEIQPLIDPAPLQAELARLNRYAMVAFVSPNAIDASFAQLAGSWPPAVTIAVIGPGSRAALAAHGLTEANARIISPRHTERTDSETLLEAMDIEALQNNKVLIIRGESGRELLADQLRRHNVDVTQVAAYRRQAPPLDKDRQHLLESLLVGKNDWIVTSSEALRNLFNMVSQLNKPESVAKMQQQRIIVSHARIAETAHATGFCDVLLTASGDERLLAALQLAL